MLFSKTPSAATLKLLLEEAQKKQLHVSIIHRLKVILFFVDHHHSITQTCRYFGIARSTFHRWIERFDPDNILSLQDHSHDSFSLRQSAVSPDTVELIRLYRMRYTQMGKEKISELLSLDHGITLSPSTVGRVIDRKCFYFADTLFHWKKRMMLNEQQKEVSAMQELQGADDVSERELLGDPCFVEGSGVSRTENSSSTSSLHAFPRARGFGFWKFLLITSVVSNIVFASVMMGIAFFEGSVSTAAIISDTQANNETTVLHSAPYTVFFP